MKFQRGLGREIVGAEEMGSMVVYFSVARLRGRKSKIQAASELSSAVSQFFRGAQSKI
jgi:hypothetical protein